MKLRFWFSLALLAFPLTASAAVRYVDLGSPSPALPYTSWATAATNIQDAIDAAEAGDEVLVSDGVYATGGRVVDVGPTNRVVVDKPITVRSLNGPASTVIQGYQVPGTTNGDAAIRCVYMTNASVLSGFTLTGGATLSKPSQNYFLNVAGGAVWCSTLEPVVTNCILTGNAAIVGGGCYRGTLVNCVISSNNTVRGGVWTGGGAGSYYSTLINCRVLYNKSSSGGGGVDGGALTNCIVQGNQDSGAANALLVNCVVVSNTAWAGGGGLYWGTAINCFIIGNWSEIDGGGTFQTALRNCLVTGNGSKSGPGGGNGRDIRNCTITGNSSRMSVGGLTGPATNCIVYFNYGSAGVSNFYGSPPWDHCCTFPLPPQQSATITNEPLFVDAASGNFRLRSDSPCINAGLNAADLTLTDLDGNPRISGGVVDIGAYEFQAPSDAIQITGVSASGGHIKLTWRSVAGRSYFVECSTNLAAPGYFIPIASNITSGGGTASWTHTNAVGTRARFYRVGVQ